MTIDEAWAIMVKYARAIDAAGYEYRPLEENSNAFIGAMIHAAEGNPDAMRPSGVSAREAVGYSSWDQMLEDIAPPADGIFRGTPGNDRLVGLQIGEHVRALGGRDSVNGRRGDDRLEGGNGADTLLGERGADLLLGQGGPDTLDGGSGLDRLLGGSGGDRFVLARPGRDQVDDFQDGIDVIGVEVPGVNDLGDLAITRSGAAGQHTLIASGDIAIELRNTDRALIDGSDFLFLVADAVAGLSGGATSERAYRALPRRRHAPVPADVDGRGGRERRRWAARRGGDADRRVPDPRGAGVAGAEPEAGAGLNDGPEHLRPIREFGLEQARRHRDIVARFGRPPHQEDTSGGVRPRRKWTT